MVQGWAGPNPQQPKLQAVVAAPRFRLGTGHPAL
jgi:hypothetical protein